MTTSEDVPGPDPLSLGGCELERHPSPNPTIRGSGSASVLKYPVLRNVSLPKDDRLRAAAASWGLLPGPVEYSGLHCGQWGPGGVCLLVSTHMCSGCDQGQPPDPQWDGR